MEWGHLLSKLSTAFSAAQQEESQNLEIDLDGAVVKAEHQPAFFQALIQSRLQHLHLSNGTVEFGAGFLSLNASQEGSTVRLTNMRLVLTPSVQPELEAKEGDRYSLVLGVCHPNTSLHLENCRWEATFDSPVLNKLGACMCSAGGQVTMINCQFSGFRIVIVVAAHARATMKDCQVDLTMRHAYGDEAPVVCVSGQRSFLSMTNCQLSISCPRIRVCHETGWLRLKDGGVAELEGVMLRGRTDVGASPDAPATSMVLAYQAIKVTENSQISMKDSTISGGTVTINAGKRGASTGACAVFDNCHITGAILARALVSTAAGACVIMRRCTVQNLCNDRSAARRSHSALSLFSPDEQGSKLECEDCVLETMQGAGVLVAFHGDVTLTRCTLRSCAAGSLSHMRPDRLGTVHLCGPTKVALQQCYVEGGPGGLAASAASGATIACRQCLLVGWGVTTDQYNYSCPVVWAVDPGTSLELQGCTVQLHPDSRPSLPTYVLMAREHASIKATDCRLVGPASGSTDEGTEFGAVLLDEHAALTLHKCSLMQLNQVGAADEVATLSLLQCTGHKGMVKLMNNSQLNIKVLGCSNCRGCNECKQPMPLQIPDGTGGSGCTAEVAVKAEALQAAATKALVSASGSEQGRKPSQKQADSGAGAGGRDHPAANSSTSTFGRTTQANPGVVECAFCHHKPGDPGVPATLKLCGGCHGPRYCSTECQRKDWKLGHKVVCQQWSEAQGGRT